MSTAGKSSGFETAEFSATAAQFGEQALRMAAHYTGAAAEEMAGILRQTAAQLAAAQQITLEHAARQREITGAVMAGAARQGARAVIAVQTKAIELGTTHTMAAVRAAREVQSAAAMPAFEFAALARQNLELLVETEKRLLTLLSPEGAATEEDE